MPNPLPAVVATFQRWLYLPDPEPLHVVLATVIANRLEGDPVWLMLVGPPSSLKTELLGSLRRLHDVWFASTLTEAALLSGVAKKDRAQGAKGGLLREIGESGILVCKDFGSILNMRREARGDVLKALREIYDGLWIRRIGSEGARAESWEGKLGFLAASTPAIEVHHGVLAEMGERFAYYRMPPLDRRIQATMARENRHRGREMRGELQEVVADFFERFQPAPKAPYIDPMEQETLDALADFIATARSPVTRDDRTREVELAPEPEAPGRISKVLAQFFEALLELGLERTVAWRALKSVAASSIPRARWGLLRSLSNGSAPLRTADLAAIVNLPWTTARRHLEDLAFLRVLERVGDEGWEITDAFQGQLDDVEIY